MVLRRNSSSDTEVGKVWVLCSTKHMQASSSKFEALPEGKHLVEELEVHASVEMGKGPK